MLCFLDTEFTALLEPRLLSLGLVTLDGREHYGELDLQSEAGQTRVKDSSDFVRFGGVLSMWGRVPGVAGSEWELGRRAGEWLLSMAAGSCERLEVAFDYPIDFELLEYSVRDAGLWDQVREIVWPLNIDLLTGNINGELAAEDCYRSLSPRGIGRHHALADALALRAAYQSVMQVSLRLSRLAGSEDFDRLRKATSLGESWLRDWLVNEQRALGHRRPLDILEEPDGLERLVTLLRQLESRVYL